MDLEGRVPPHSDEAERSLLGAMMLSREAVMMAVEMLTPDDFYDSAHRALFLSMCALFAAGRPVDLVTMTEELNRTGRMEGIGGLPYLAALSQSMPSAANAQAYARIVEEKSILRRMIRACDDISSACYAEEKPVPEILRLLTIRNITGVLLLKKNKCYHEIKFLQQNTKRPVDRIIYGIALRMLFGELYGHTYGSQ